ncbi:type II toxin-antitoxin system Phd/YefM family antitoxin [Candidatus Poriferisodalis sp.]|uniref:type II toxin-antitoxin system Phd/YefM family antitoxin n=1 Tax=Candidatus Poriferisodalis sp. TaxID=3101277 RepID=UPI003B523AF0
MAEALPISEAKTRLSELADRIERQHERIVVTRHGRPSFVLIGAGIGADRRTCRTPPRCWQL